MEKENHRFQVKKFLFETTAGTSVGRYMLTDRQLPMLIPNQYIETKSMNKAATGRMHAVKLCRFFNYLHEKHAIDYESAANTHVKQFLDTLIYGDATALRVLAPFERPSHSTLAGYIGVITDFYRWLDENYGSEMRFFEGERLCRTQSYLYGQIYSRKYTSIVKRVLPDTKGSREYIKWYTGDEITRLCESFRTLRDEAVFRLTLEGFRIDEVLSMSLSGYDREKMTIRPTRSKRKPDAVKGKASKIRLVRLNVETCRIIDIYLFEERAAAENESGNISDTMFINLSHGKRMGLPLLYPNYREILKAVAKRAGLEPEKIRTHSGRSTHVMEILEFNAENPDKAYSEIEIQQIFGWANINSIQPYRNNNSEIMALAFAKRRNGGKNDD